MKINIIELINQGKLPNFQDNNDVNYFTLFDLEKEYNINSAKLKKSYLNVQINVHPDKFVQKEIKYQKIALEWATYANNAFNTLNNNAQKALYWCKLHDVDTNVQVEMHILEQTMDWHEAIIDDVSDYNKKLIKLSAKQLGQDYSNKFNDLSVIDEKNALLGKYAQTLLLIDRFLANTF